MASTKERKNFVYIAKLAEQAERYEEMVDAMKNVAKLNVELTLEERNLLSVGYKNIVGARRASWRILSSIEQKEEAKGNDQNVKRIKEYRQKVESELSNICSDIMIVIDEHLIPSCSGGEPSVLFYKMKGDYYRYMAEYKSGDQRKEDAGQSMKAYQMAFTTAEAELPPTHPIRLGLVLNFSVFYYENLNSPERACHLAKQAFDEAISELDTLSEESYKDSTLIMQLLRDNLTLWTSDIPEDGAEEQKVESARAAGGDAEVGYVPTRKINQKTHRDLLAQAIVHHDLPFNFVEYEKIREWVNYLNPDVVMHSRNTAVSDIKKIYTREKDKLKQVMSKIPNRVCLTSDVWTASTTEGYICLTAHFVDDNWKLVSKILNFCRMMPPHTGSEIEAVLFNCLKHWGIDKKLFSITLDNASANVSMRDILKTHLCVQNNLLCDGDYFYVHCSAHILNLIVQDGLKVTSEALNKIRESVKYVRGSDGRMVKFKECVRQADIDTGVGLRLDVPTRWNSTYLMLESAIKYEKAFDILRVIDTNFKSCPSDEEWRRGETLCEFLEPFYETTNMISGSSYPTSNLYFLQVWKIECLLEENSLNEDEVISEMSYRMKAKFDKYWKDYSVVLAFGAILDPRMKLDFVLFGYTTLDPSTAQDKVKNLREQFEKLYGEYVSNINTPSVSQSQPVSESSMVHKSSGEGSRPKRSKVFKEFKKFQNETKSNIGKSELDLYLEEKALDYDDNEDLDVLNYWKINEKRFPVLAIMARDVLSIPITTVASESAFSIGGRVLTKYRSSTLPENVQMLICTRNWLHGFDLNPNDEDDCKPVGRGTTVAESNVHQEEEIED